MWTHVGPTFPVWLGPTGQVNMTWTMSTNVFQSLHKIFLKKTDDAIRSSNAVDEQTNHGSFIHLRERSPRQV